MDSFDWTDGRRRLRIAGVLVALTRLARAIAAAVEIARDGHHNQPAYKRSGREDALLRRCLRFGDFPILPATYRECVADMFDLDALRNLLSGILALRR